MGQRRIVHPVRGRGTGLGLAGVGAGRQGAGVRRRQRLRHPLRRGLRRARRPRPHPPPPLDRVGPHRARAGPARHRGDRALPSRCCGPPGPPASSRGSRCTTSRCPGGSRWTSRASSTSGPATYYWPRHVDFMAETFGDLVFGWKPVNEPSAYALLGWRLGRVPARACPTPSGSPRRSRRSTSPPSTPRSASARPASRSRRSTTSRRWSPPSRCPTPRWPATGSTTSSTACGSRRCATASSHVPGRAPIERDEFRTAFDLIGFSYYNAMSIDRNGRIGALPGRRPARARWATRRGARASASLLQRLAEDLPDQPLLVCEHGIGTDDDGWREEFLRESLGFVAAGGRRRHRPPRVLPLDRGRQLRVDLRLLGPLRPLRRRTARRSPAPRCMRSWATVGTVTRGRRNRRRPTAGFLLVAGALARDRARAVPLHGAGHRPRRGRGDPLGAGDRRGLHATRRRGRPARPVHEAGVGAARAGRPAPSGRTSARCSRRSAARPPWLRSCATRACGRPGLVTAVVVANPWFLIAATSTVDFLWALALLLTAAWLLRTDRAVLAGLAAALAIGCRASTVALVACLVVAELLDRCARRGAGRSSAAGGRGRRRAPGLRAVVPRLRRLARVRAERRARRRRSSSSSAGSPPRTSTWSVRSRRSCCSSASPRSPGTLARLRVDWIVRFGALGLLASQLLFLRFPWKMGHLLPSLVFLAILLGVALGAPAPGCSPRSSSRSCSTSS